ncbi:MAG: type I restriction endonuclease, partial [Rickettsiella sp.]|nr:type I restriction endonuclease [Rickettsiella sp.]
MSDDYSEDKLVEGSAEQVLKELGWQVIYAWGKETFGDNGLLGRDNKSEVILTRYLRSALKKFNPDLPDTVYEQAIQHIIEQPADKTLVKINQEKHELLTQGIKVTYQDEKKQLIEKRLRVFDFDNPFNNEFIAVRQLQIQGEVYHCRPDMIGFVNGIPLLLIEFKVHYTKLIDGYEKNLTDYKLKIPAIFYCNAFIILSNGLDTKIGTLTSPYKYFLEWKRIKEHDEGIVSLDTVLRGTCDPKHLMDIFENFLLFDDGGSEGHITKLIARNHQYIGVNKVIKQMHYIEHVKGKLGVFWHTQGSDKSYSIIFLCQKIHRKFGGAYTFLIVADRSELENQLYDNFTSVGAITEKVPKAVVATNRQDLRRLLAENHRYVFTLIHKFSFDPKKENEYPLITERKNIIVISDEAHRTQAGKFAQN